MAPTEAARKNHEELFPGHVSTLEVTDPELIELFDNFAFDEVLRQGVLDTRTRVMVQLASMIASQALGEYRVMLGAALTVGVTPVQGIVGTEAVDAMNAAADDDENHFQHFLSGNCFGDHLARTGIDIPTRELLTLAMLVSLGGCEPQVKGHVAVNLNVGNDRRILLDVLTQLGGGDPAGLHNPGPGTRSCQRKDPAAGHRHRRGRRYPPGNAAGCRGRSRSHCLHPRFTGRQGRVGEHRLRRCP